MIERGDELVINGVKSSEIVEEHGTPVYVYDAATVKKRYRSLENAFRSRYENFSISYAVKANFNPSIVKLLVEEGAYLDCASLSELKLAEELGVDEKMYTAPYTSRDEVEHACELDATVNFDGIYALKNSSKLPERVSFRIDPGIGKGDFGLVLGGGDTKFGVPEEHAVKAYRKAKERGVERFGIHMMTGSNVREPEYFAQITRKLLQIAGSISEELGIQFEFVDIGGGLGIPYEPGQEPLDVEETAEKVVEAFENGIEKYGLGKPELRVEPGRFLVAESGILLSEVTGVREKGGKNFIGIDTGMNHFLRPMLYDAYHEILPAENPEKKSTGKKDVVGYVCENTDVFAKDRELPEFERGDLLAVMDTGAYGFAMASNWNTRPRPAEILVEDGETRVIRKPEEPMDVFQGTEFPHKD